MKKLQSHPHLVALALALVTMSVSLAMLARLVPSPKQMLARGIRDELDAAPPATVALHLTQLETLREAALPALVDAMASDRVDVSSGARRLIDTEFTRWQELPTDVGSRHVEHLARLLAAHAPNYGASSREHARQLTLRILEWPIDRDAVDRTQLIATCEIVLRLAGEVVPATLASKNFPPTPAEGEAALIDPRDLWHAREEPNDASNRVSGDPDFEVAAPPETPVLPATQPELGVPRPPVAEDRSQSVGTPPTGGARWSASEPAQRARPPLASSQLSKDRQAPRVAFPDDSPLMRAAPLIVPNFRDLQKAETIVVMRWLLVEDAAAIAKAVLVDRGFSEVQLRIARQIVDPDPIVRLELARSLPNIAGNDPRPWLLWLSRDVDADVRRATVGILATSPDPVLQKRLRELELEETDASVLNVVRRALEQPARRY